MEVVSYPHIRLDDGVAKIGETRFKVIHLASEHYCHGWTAEEILRQHPDLQPEEVYAALGYFYDHYDEMVKEIRESEENAKQLRASTKQPSRSELLARKSDSD